MPGKGKHRRLKSRSISRGFVAVSAGGAALVLPMIGASTAGAAEKAAPSANTYTVVAGDSLAKIARSHAVDGGWKKLYEDNRKAVGDNPGVILPGLKLAVAEKSAETKGNSADAKSAAADSATYSNDLDGWIKESLAVMKEHGIPGTYEGIHRNIIRESGGDPMAINNWDINAVNGTPSKGLLQVIAPTFEAYHVPGTSTDSYDPVANITAACNYAADRYGSIDNVNGPY